MNDLRSVQCDRWICCSAATLTLEDVASLRHFSRDQIKLTMFLGSGAFGEVFEGVATNIISENSGSTKVAVKVQYTSTCFCYNTPWTKPRIAGRCD